MKVYYPDSRVLARQNVFSVRVVQVWNNLPNEVVSATCVSVFKSLLNSIHVSFFNVVLSMFLGSCKCSLSLSAHRHSSFYYILLFYILLIVSVSTNKIYTANEKEFSFLARIADE